MNGKEKAQLQIKRGTRTIIDEVDSIRLAYGFNNVTVLTPIVEVRLRSGLLPPKPLKLSLLIDGKNIDNNNEITTTSNESDTICNNDVDVGNSNNDSIVIQLEYKIGFPTEPIKVEITIIPSNNNNNRYNNSDFPLPQFNTNNNKNILIPNATINDTTLLQYNNTDLFLIEKIIYQINKLSEYFGIEIVSTNSSQIVFTALPNNGAIDDNKAGVIIIKFIQQCFLNEQINNNITTNNSNKFATTTANNNNDSNGNNDITDTNSSKALGDIRFHCKYCRTELFSGSELHPHSVANFNRILHTSGYNNSNNNNDSSSSSQCNSYYLEQPPNWMLDKIYTNENSNNGKIVCMKCNNRLGNWGWTGQKCYCNSSEDWIVPAFQFTISKIDIKINNIII